MIVARQSTARTVTIGPVLDASGAAVTDSVVGDFKIAKNGGAPAALNGSATLTHRHTGNYSLALTASDLDTVGQAEITCDDTVNACAVKEITIVEEAVYDELFAASALGYIANAPVNVAQFGGSNGTFASGRPEINLTHIAGSIVDNTSPQIGANLVAIHGDSGASQNAEKYFDGTGFGDILVRTVISSLSSQTSFVLTAGATQDDAYNDRLIIIEDNGASTSKCVASVSDYTGASKTVTLAADPGIFTIAAGDIVTILAVRSGTELDSISSLATAAELAKVPKSDSNVTWNATALASIQSEAEDALIAHNLDHLVKSGVDTDFATTVHVDSVVGQLAQTSDGGFSRASDSLEAIRDRGDAAWITATGFSTHSAADVWAVGTRSLTVLDEDSTTLDLDATIRAAIGMAAANLDTQLGDIPTNAELATALGTADDAVLAAIAALNNLSAATVRTQCDDALVAIHLDHLLAATYDPASKPGSADALLNELVESDAGVARFTANALEQAPTGGSAPTASAIADEVQTRTIAGVTLVATTTNLTNLPTIPNNWLTAAGLASDAVTEIQSGLATSSAVSTLQTSVNDVPTNAELATALDPLPTAAEIRAEIDSNSTQLAAIVADTNELQTDLANGGRVDLLIDGIKAKTDNLPSDPADQSLVESAITTATSGLATASALTTVGNNVAAILADTGTDGVVLSTATMQSIATALLDLSNGVETSFTLRQALRLILSSAAGELSGAATSEITIRDINDTKTRITATVDASGNRTAVVVDAT